MNRLITIPMSHYCEKARWALELAGVPYQEIKHMQGFHYLYSFSTSGGPTVPVLITRDEIFSDSTKILKWTDTQRPDSDPLYPKNAELRTHVEEFEDYLDEVFGPAGRLWMYSYMLDEVDTIFKYSRAQGIPGYEIRLMSAIFPLFKPFISRRLKMSSDSRIKTKELVDGVLDAVRMQLGAKKYLFGDTFTAADLAFAALSAAVILPEKYGVPLPRLDELPLEMAEQVKVWRAHPAGKFAARIYEENRKSRLKTNC